VVGQHDGVVRDQASRDEETLRIFSAVLVFAAVVGVGGGLLALARSATGMPDGVVSAGVAALLALPAGLALVPLRRD
jgi:hypothetical protein